MTTKIIGGKLPWCDKKRWVWPESDKNRLQRCFRDGPGDLDSALPMLMPHLKDRRTVVQAGGCVGIWPLRLSMFFQTVRTFEPDPINFRCLEANTHHLKNVIATHGALGEREKKVGLEVRNPANPGTFFVNECGEIPMTTIDSLHIEDLDLVYLDVEGYEVQVLRGAAATISRCRPVIGVEDYPDYAERYGLPNVVHWLVAEFGYKLLGRVEGQQDAILVPA